MPEAVDAAAPATMLGAVGPIGPVEVSVEVRSGVVNHVHQASLHSLGNHGRGRTR